MMKPPLKKLLNAENPQNHRVFNCKELILAKDMTYTSCKFNSSPLNPWQSQSNDCSSHLPIIIFQGLSLFNYTGIMITLPSEERFYLFANTEMASGIQTYGLGLDDFYLCYRLKADTFLVA